MSKSIIPYRIVRREHIVGFSLGLGIVVGSSAWLACGSETFQGAQADAGQTVPSGCDLTVDPKDSPPCVDDRLGLFVSSTTGDDTHPGTKSSPLKTISAAIAKADAQHNRVYICTGTYPETVKLTTTTSLFGGFSCTDWSYAGSQSSVVPKVVPTKPGFALDIENVNGPVFVEDLEADAPAAQNPGDSSIAVFVSSSSGPITFRRVTAIAKDGNAGAPAATTSNYTVGSVNLNGNNAAGNTGAAAKDCTVGCMNGEGSIGGKGGDLDSIGGDGGPNIPANPVGHDGKGGTNITNNTTCSGPPDVGADAFDTDGGAPAPSSPGTVSAAGWQVTLGMAGATGGPGQGGGGGQGQASGTNGAGGGGACGGCGGAGGNGGGSGGSSFAMLIFQAVVIVDTCTARVGSGGDGQPGGSGQPGETGGTGGVGALGGGELCAGANGGKGGDGAGGGGGAGGDAIALAYVGTQPTLNGGSQSEGHAGAGAAGGTGNSGNNGVAGANGTKSDIAELP